MVAISSQFRGLASIAYYRCGRTMAQKSEIKAALDSSENDLRAMVEEVHAPRQKSFLNKSVFH